MATIDDFLPGVEGIFGEIPIPVLYAQIRRAAIELCSRSLIWKERYALALVNEQSLYDLPVPAGSRPVIMHAVVSNHGRIISKTEQQLDVEYPTWREARSTFRPSSCHASRQADPVLSDSGKHPDRRRGKPSRLAGADLRRRHAA